MVVGNGSNYAQLNIIQPFAPSQGGLTSNFYINSFGIYDEATSNVQNWQLYTNANTVVNGVLTGGSGGGLNVGSGGLKIYSSDALFFQMGASIHQGSYPTGGTNPNGRNIVFNVDGSIRIGNNNISNSHTTGALVVGGGIGLNGNISFSDDSIQSTAWTGSVSSLVNNSAVVSLGSDGALTLANGSTISDNSGLSFNVVENSSLDNVNVYDFSTDSQTTTNIEILKADYPTLNAVVFAGTTVSNHADPTYSTSVTSIFFDSTTWYVRVLASWIAGLYGDGKVNFTNNSANNWKLARGLTFPDNSVQSTAFTGFGGSLAADLNTNGHKIYDSTKIDLAIQSGLNWIFDGNGISVINTISGSDPNFSFGPNNTNDAKLVRWTILSGNDQISYNAGALVAPDIVSGIVFDVSTALQIGYNTNDNSYLGDAAAGEVIITDNTAGWTYKFLYGGGNVQFIGSTNPDAWVAPAPASNAVTLTGWVKFEHDTTGYKFTNLAGGSRNYVIAGTKTK